MVSAAARKKSGSTGKSGITPCKHFLLNRLLGREVGVISTGRLSVCESFLFDLTAGDGVPYLSAEQGELMDDRRKAFAEGCSPGIFLTHADWLVSRRRVPVCLVGCEKQAITHAELIANTDQWLAEHEWDKADRGVHFKAGGMGEIRYLHSNSKNINPPGGIRNATCFIYNDPNHIEDWSLTPEFVSNCPRLTTSLSTLGCNVGGLKRIEEDKRREWFMRVEVLCEALLQSWHDACLFSVGGADQWAYLITAPAKWRDEITAECFKAAQKLEKKITAAPQVIWRKQDPAAFYELERFLFLTRDEFNRGVQL